MPIETNFTFDHKFAPPPPGMAEADVAAAPVDLLGPLRGLVGATHKGKGERTWKGHGFNMIWRPNFGGQSGPTDFFLELNFTAETLAFTDITGLHGVANRGFLQKDIALGAVSYLQTISDTFDNSGQHFEPGVWANVPATTGPAEKHSVVRMGSIPHGTTVNMQGHAFAAPKPQFAKASITPFRIGSPDDGQTGLVHFDEEKLSMPSQSRTDLNNVAALTQEHLTDPNRFLSDAVAHQTFLNMTVIEIASEVKLVGSVPDSGGGVDNIAFLKGNGAGPNADAVPVSATFWIERVRDQHGHEFDQLQYTQRVLLNFNGLSWPHVTVATLRPVIA